MLARDGKVLQEVALSHPTSSIHPRVPFVLWARLRRDLGAHLTEVETDGTWVFRWTHSQLARVCVERYLKTDEARMLVHADYADYYRAGGEHAHVFQPLAWTLGERGGEEEEEGEVEESGMRSYVFNLRKLNGLPHHLVLSGQILPFLSECVFNYEFLLHKAWGLSVLHVEEDLKKATLPDKWVYCTFFVVDSHVREITGRADQSNVLCCLVLSLFSGALLPPPLLLDPLHDLFLPPSVSHLPPPPSLSHFFTPHLASKSIPNPSLSPLPPPPSESCWM